MKIDCGTFKAVDKISKTIKKDRLISKIIIISSFVFSFIIIYPIGELLTIGVENRIVKTIFGIMDIIIVLYLICSPIILIVFIPIFLLFFSKKLRSYS